MAYQGTVFWPSHEATALDWLEDKMVDCVLIMHYDTWEILSPKEVEEFLLSRIEMIEGNHRAGYRSNIVARRFGDEDEGKAFTAEELLEILNG